MNLDPTFYGLTKRVVLEKTPANNLAIAIRRKSRFLRKDAAAFYEKAELIKKSTGEFPILVLQAPLCSKARLWLQEHAITILEEPLP